MKNFISKTAIYGILLLGLTTACDNMTDTYDGFIGEGEITYIGTPSSVLIGHGYNKLRFDVVINADPKITKGIVKTNDESVYHEFSVVRNTNGQQTVTFDLDVPEGDYTFGVYLMDANNNSSVKKEISSRVYGATYKANLITRSVASITKSSGDASITWGNAISGSLNSFVTYVDASGVQQKITIPNVDKVTLITNYPLGGEFSVSSSYKPTPTAIELFESAPSKRNFPN